jgi:hypothetical protein
MNVEMKNITNRSFGGRGNALFVNNSISCNSYSFGGERNRNECSSCHHYKTLAVRGNIRTKAPEI